MTNEPGPTRIAELPLVLSIAETARALRCSTRTAYSLARLFEASGGEEGLPTIRVGHALRVPRHRLIERFDLGDSDEGHQPSGA